MGGSGGGGGGGGRGYFSPTDDPEKLAQDIRRIEDETRSQRFDAEVSAELTQLLAAYNGRDTTAIRRHLDEILRALEKELEGRLDTIFGGSVFRNTYVEGLSDIDSLVILNDSELARRDPESVLAYFKRRLEERFPETSVSRGVLAITVKFRDAEVQILPARRTESGALQIGSAEGAWATINPGRFRDILVASNEAAGGKLVPTIKLVKAINSRFSKPERLSGYHVEALAIEVFRAYAGPKNLKAMLLPPL